MRSGGLHRLTDARVGAAATQVARQGLVDLLVAGFGSEAKKAAAAMIWPAWH
jgi:hypothetical protein